MRRRHGMTNSVISSERKLIGLITNNAMTKSKTTTPKHASPSISHDELMVKMFRDDPEWAAVSLSEVLKDGTQEEFLRTLGHITSAFGGMSGVARTTKLNARSLYRTLSERGNPRLDTIIAILDAVGMRISVTPKTAKEKSIKSPVKGSTRGRAVARV